MTTNSQTVAVQTQVHVHAHVPIRIQIRNAIAMNNHAIAMIEKQCYEEGTRILYDAYQMIRSISNCDYSNAAGSTGAGIQQNENACYHHYESISNFAIPSLCKTPIPFVTMTSLCTVPAAVTTEYDDDSSLSIVSEPLSSSLRLLQFIRLEDTSFMGGQPSFSIVIECSIILNNLAVSYLILSTVTTNVADYYNFRAVACTFVQLGSARYIQVVETTCTNSVATIDHELYRLLGYILSNTEKILQFCNVPIEQYNIVFDTKVIQLWKKIRRIESFFLTCTDGITDHTAAMA